jgi:hypothetical protein
MSCTADYGLDKWQTRPHVTEGAPHRQNRNKSLVLSPRWGLIPELTDRLTVGRNVTSTLKLVAAMG